jgi:hypothetical protein
MAASGPPGGGQLALPRPAFRFEPRRARLDWRMLAALDADRIARETDIDALERALDTVSFGDISVEDPRHLSGAAAPAGAATARPLRALQSTAVWQLLLGADVTLRRGRRAEHGEALPAGADDGGVPAARAGACGSARVLQGWRRKKRTLTGARRKRQ